MTSSPPKPPASSRPPAAAGSADAGRRITALAAGGSVLMLSASAVALWPRTYGTEATFVVEGDAVANAAALASRVESTLLERDELARVAIELPPELRSPDPIGRLRAGIRVQSRGPLGYVVEFRGSDPKSVQRIANLLAERAVALVPKLAAAPQDPAPARALADRTRAVTEFLTAHPEVTLEPTTEGKAAPGPDRGLEALRTEKRRIEQRLTTGATDNPYADANQTPEVLSRRLAELKSTIARRESALKDPKPDSPPSVSPDLVAQWRQLLAEMAAAQAAALAPGANGPPTTARLTARAPLPTSPITPNRWVLSLVGLLLSAAAGLIAYVLPRKPEPVRRGPRSTRPAPSPLAPGVARSEPLRPRTESSSRRSDPSSPIEDRPRSSEPPRPSSEPPRPSSEPPRPSSEPPHAVMVQRTVVLTGPSASSGAPASLPPRTRQQTAPGGLEAPAAQATALPASGASLTVPASAHGPPAAPLLGSRPPPGAGSYSVSSSHPPPMDSRPGSGRVERLTPLQSAHPPTTASGTSPSRRDVSSAQPDASAPQIVSRPPALDPDAESWAAHFETPPAEPTRPTHPQPSPEPADGDGTRKRAGRWKTQVMGSMVPIEVMTARADLSPPSSESLESVPSARPIVRQVPSPSATTVVHRDVPYGWGPPFDGNGADAIRLRDAVLEVATGRSITLLVTGSPRADRARVAAELALSLAEAGARTLLLEADFDHPELHRTLAINAPPGAGFSQQLMARRTDRHVEPWNLIRCSANLLVLVEGRFRSPGVVLTKEFESALADLAEQHHILLVHAPSLAQPDDLRPLGLLAHGVILVEVGTPAQLRVGEQPLRGLI